MEIPRQSFEFVNVICQFFDVPSAGSSLLRLPTESGHPKMLRLILLA